jgi:putative oxidoreductase
VIAKILAAPATSARVSTGLLVLRVVLGLVFIQYGSQKLAAPTHWAGHAYPVYVQLYGLAAEFGGGLLLLFGALTPVAAFLLLVEMLGAAAVFVIPHAGTTWIARNPAQLTLERNMIYAAGAIAIMLTGPGAFSIDALAARHRGKSS